MARDRDRARLVAAADGRVLARVGTTTPRPRLHGRIRVADAALAAGALRRSRDVWRLDRWRDGVARVVRRALQRVGRRSRRVRFTAHRTHRTAEAGRHARLRALTLSRRA